MKKTDGNVAYNKTNYIEWPELIKQEKLVYIFGDYFIKNNSTNFVFSKFKVVFLIAFFIIKKALELWKNFAVRQYFRG